MAEIGQGLIGESDHESEIIRQRVQQADLGVFIEEEEMAARVQAMLQPL
jgi:hypothetical protein